MLSRFQSSAERMERSLQALTDSIAAYNPSTAAADELMRADDALNQDVQALIEHQRNHRYIEELKRTTAELDDKIRNHLRQLAELRQEIASIPSSHSDLDDRKVNVSDVLAFAKFMSPTTVPPTHRKSSKQDPASSVVKAEPTDTQMTNGIVTPQQQSDNAPYVKSESLAVKTMNEAEKAWLDPLAKLPFEPWPSHELIASGALGEVQRMIERGEDPATVRSQEEQAEYERKKQEEQEKEKAEEAEKERRRVSMFDSARRRNTMEQEDVFNPDD